MNAVLVVTDDLDGMALPDAFASAQVEPRPTVADWQDARLVVIDGRHLDAVLDADLPRRSRVVIVGYDLDDATVWAKAVDVGASNVVFLPDAAPWLTARATEPVAGCGVMSGQPTSIPGDLVRLDDDTALRLRRLDADRDTFVIDRLDLDGDSVAGEEPAVLVLDRDAAGYLAAVLSHLLALPTEGA